MTPTPSPAHQHPDCLKCGAKISQGVLCAECWSDAPTVTPDAPMPTQGVVEKSACEVPRLTEKDANTSRRINIIAPAAPDRYDALRTILRDVVVIDEAHVLDVTEGAYERLEALFVSRPAATTDGEVRIVQLCWPQHGEPFNKFDCKIVDVVHADKILTVECPEASAEITTLRAELEQAASDKTYWDKTNGHLTDEIATLRAENERLQELLSDALKMCGEYNRDSSAWRQHLSDVEQSLRAALSTRPTDGPGDSAMLDWLEENPDPVFGHSKSENGSVQWWVEGVGDLPTLRAAIRAAMQSQEGAQ